MNILNCFSKVSTLVLQELFGERIFWAFLKTAVDIGDHQTQTEQEKVEYFRFFIAERQVDLNGLFWVAFESLTRSAVFISSNLTLATSSDIWKTRIKLIKSNGTLSFPILNGDLIGKSERRPILQSDPAENLSFHWSLFRSAYILEDLISVSSNHLEFLRE